MERLRDEKGHFIKTHGNKKTKLYKVWCGIKERCFNPHNKRYKNYGGRGITICNEWLDFLIFKEWAYKTGYKEIDNYKEKLTIDRIDTNGNYEPDNCRWITPREQNRNYSKNHFLTYNSKTQCLSDWADELGIKRGTLLYRIKSGKTIEEAFKKGDMRYGK